MPRREKAQCTMLASIYQIKLSIQIDQLLRDLYGVRPIYIQDRIIRSKEHRDDLELWHKEVIALFESPSTPLTPTAKTQKMGLDLPYVHAVMLIYRPFLLTMAPQSWKEQTEMQSLSEEEQKLVEENIKECLDAAMQTLRLCLDFFEAAPAAWFGHLVAFTAIVVIYMWMIQLPTTTPSSTWNSYFEEAEKCHDFIKNKAPIDSFGKKCIAALDEMKTEAMNRVQENSTRPASSDGSSGEEGSRSVSSGPSTGGESLKQPQLKDHNMFSGFSSTRRRTSPVLEKIEQWGFNDLIGF